MTYVSRKEKVFALPDQDEGSSVSLAKSSDHRLKIFPAVCENLSAHFDECHKYQNIAGLVNGKEQSNKSRQPGFKFVPIDVLLTILMAEKDAYIQELLERQEQCTCGERLFKANQFDDSEDDKEALIRKDAEVVALKNRNAVLESELEECRDTLRKAMHKLEDVEGILNENVHLSEKLKHAEEMLKLSEKSKNALEIKLQGRGAAARPNEVQNPELWTEDDHNRLLIIYKERDALKQQVQELGKELTEAKASLAEIGVLQQQCEEVCRQNECYKKKLEAMKNLEKSLGDLKKQARGLAEKYKRESNRANELEKHIDMNVKELQILREEKEMLQKRLNQSSKFEADYYSIKEKLAESENEVLNSKLSILDKLGKENEDLRKELERLRLSEIELNKSKDKIVQMQGELASQEGEIKDLVSQINLLSNEYVDGKEYNRLKDEYQEKILIINQNEKELKEIHVLRAETEKLRGKLQKYEDDLMSYEKSAKQLQDELQMYKEKYHRLIKAPLEPIYVATRFEEKVRFANELSVIQEPLTETCPLLELNNSELRDEGQVNEESRMRNDENLKMGNNAHNTKMSEKKLNAVAIQVEEIDVMLLKNNLANCVGCLDLKNHSAKLESDIFSLEQANQQLQHQLNLKIQREARMEKLENSIRIQKRALDFLKRLLTETEGKLWFEIFHRKMAEALSGLLKEEVMLTRKEISVSYLTEVENLRNEMDLRKQLITELRKENHILRKMRIFTEFTGKRALANVTKKLKQELNELQSLSKLEIEAECRRLQAEAKRLVDEADELKIALDAERKSKNYIEKKLSLIEEELSNVAKSRTESKVVQNASTVTADFEYDSDEIKKALLEIKFLKEENDEFFTKIAALQDQCKDFENEVNSLQINKNELEKCIRDEKIITNRQKEEIDALNEKIKICQDEVRDFKIENEGFNQKAIALREELTAKEAELDRTKKEITDMKNEIVKLKAEVDVLKNRAGEKEETGKSIERDEDKQEESEETILRVEKEFEELRIKLDSCSTTEEKLTILRTKRDNLIVKAKCFESEVDFLKKKLMECDVIKTELEQLKAEKKTMNDFHMNIESEEKLLSDIFGLREQIRLQQKEIEHARFENTDLKGKLQELGKILESYKTLQNDYQKTDVDITAPNNSCLNCNENYTNRVDSSTSCEQIGDAISIEEFKMEIAKIESKHKVKVQKLRIGNADKIKKLMEQYEKESKNRNKIYNESLNNIKSNYENDIRKLVEKHKLSIRRLQNLHEDEVQELNTNYETQMEAMQTLNENVVNDLTSGAVEKCKLTERYNKEIKDLESNFQKLLKEKEKEHKIEISNLQGNLARNVNEQKEMHKQDLANLSRIYEENIAQLREKHSRELKKFKKNNLKRAEVMRYKYEALLSEERKKYEEQLQIMLDRSKIGQQGDQIQDELKFLYLKKQSYSPGRLEFNKILEKIIIHGLESLPFHELMFVHCKTCFAAESFFEDLNVRAEQEAHLTGEGCIHMPLLKEDKEELLKRIFILENEIAIKQLETHEAIISMDTAEKCRMEELNVLLRNEREKNSELKELLNNQTRAQTDLKIESYVLDRQAALHETNYIEKVKELEVERSETRRLEEDLEKERNNSKRLSLLLENERQRFKNQRKKDSDYIEAMRMRLEEALSHEQIMESQLDYEAQFRTKLEFELQSLQTSFNLIRDPPSSPISLESKAVKDIKNLDQFESEKEEKLSKCKSKVKSHKSLKF